VISLIRIESYINIYTFIYTCMREDKKLLKLGGSLCIVIPNWWIKLTSSKQNDKVSIKKDKKDRLIIEKLNGDKS